MRSMPCMAPGQDHKGSNRQWQAMQQEIPVVHMSNRCVEKERDDRQNEEREHRERPYNVPALHKEKLQRLARCIVLNPLRSKVEEYLNHRIGPGKLLRQIGLEVLRSVANCNHF